MNRSNGQQRLTHHLDAMWKVSNQRSGAVLAFAASMALSDTYRVSEDDARGFALRHLPEPMRSSFQCCELRIVGAPPGSGLGDLAVFFDEDAPFGESDPIIHDQAGTLIATADVVEYVREQLRQDILDRYESARLDLSDERYAHLRVRADLPRDAAEATNA